MATKRDQCIDDDNGCDDKQEASLDYAVRCSLIHHRNRSLVLLAALFVINDLPPLIIIKQRENSFRVLIFFVVYSS